MWFCGRYSTGLAGRIFTYAYVRIGSGLFRVLFRVLITCLDSILQEIVCLYHTRSNVEYSQFDARNRAKKNIICYDYVMMCMNSA